MLDPKTRQLNGDHAYPGGHSANQLRTWNYQQMFTSAVDKKAIKHYQHTFAIDDENAALENRVRSQIVLIGAMRALAFAAEIN